MKVVSIFGNTGDGKSYTLNHTFFQGQEVRERAVVSSLVPRLHSPASFFLRCVKNCVLPTFHNASSKFKAGVDRRPGTKLS